MLLTTKCQAVANYIIDEIDKYNEGKGFREQVFLSTKRLQKLLFFSQVLYMIKNGGKAMFDDDFYAWGSGPVIPDIYYKFFQYRDGNVRKIDDLELESCDKEIKTIVDIVLNETKDFDTCHLIQVSQVVTGPWDNVYDENDINHRQLIPKEMLFDFYLDNYTYNVPKVKKYVSYKAG